MSLEPKPNTDDFVHRRVKKKRVGSFFFEQLVTLVMFFSKVFDVENHVSIMRKSEISVIFRAILVQKS